jgi:probable F420-dependent oxidoreductase
MKLGLYGLNMGAHATPSTMANAARAAEIAGFDSVWMGEHFALPDPQTPPSPLPPHHPILDSLESLTYVAAHTSTLKLATGIIVLPQRNPVMLAKLVATLDVLSAGRVVLGIGAGYLSQEFRMLQTNFKDRGVITDEYLDALIQLWYHQSPTHHGRFASFESLDAQPRPIQEFIPLIIGGWSKPAWRRAVTRGHGWYGFWLSPKATAKAIKGLHDAALQYERPASLAELEISVTPPIPLTRSLAEEYAELGVHRLIPRIPEGDFEAELTIEAALGSVRSL